MTMNRSVQVEETDRQFKITCPNCGKIHYHGSGSLGWRSPHCTEERHISLGEYCLVDSKSTESMKE